LDTLNDDQARRRQRPGSRYLRAIRNSLMLLLPIVFVGALALLLGSFPYAAVLPPPALALSEQWRALAMLASAASNGILALGLLVLISHFLAADARGRHPADISPPLLAVLALTNFFIVTRFPESASAQWTLGPRSVLPAIVIAIASTELYLFFARFRRLRFGQRGYVLNPSLHLALAAVGPALATVVVGLLLSQAWMLLSFDPSLWIKAAVIWFDGAADSDLPGLLLLGVVHQLLWFVGIHGSHALASVYPILFSEPGEVTQVFKLSAPFLSLYAYIGGSGATLGLLLAILTLARGGEGARVARYALLPSLFNINELLIFGLPIIFNPIYLLPFVLAPLANITLSYFCLQQGWVVSDVTSVPWMTPPILGGIINSGSWHGGARIEKIKARRASVLNRHDEVGHAARKLLHEFMHDLGSERVYLAYQPQHDREGRVVGLEALLRWRHRHFDLISAGGICALLEEAREINRLGRWAIATACRQLRDWKSIGVDGPRVSINLSPLQLRDTGLVAHVAECLAENALEAHEIALELTESQYVPDDSRSLAALRGLEQLGVDLEMDDFGMGYSSMLYIRRFKFAAIKLDGVLTRDVLHDKNCRDIIASVVQLGAASGIRVVAEYVETRAQQSMLAELGCDEFQGYLYSPPLAAARCLDYLKTQAAGGA
jgi:lactose/cellobiose-specific phosphotransferase system IIC component